MPDPEKKIGDTAAETSEIPPDLAEEESSDQIDTAAPARGYNTLPVVGLGGSAGSIEALQRFFSAMPPDSGMCFIVILHLLPEHESRLAQVLQRCTSMPVAEAQSGQRVEANHVYVIPPGKHLTMADGHLRLLDLKSESGKRVAIDYFFRALADAHGPHSVAVILSGMDADGTVGIKRIKECGGLTVAQEPREAQSPVMPESAIATGMVDWILPASEIPPRLMNYQALEGRVALPPEELAPPEVQPQADETVRNGESELREVLHFLRTRTGRDFSYYKRATILRRIGRRMRVNEIDKIGDYLRFLRTHPAEAGALLQDLLISVTNFFRDRHAFDYLRDNIAGFFHGKGSGDAVRVWVAACATGEEAYSVGMLLHEYAANCATPPKIQIFATDLDASAIQAARDGLYPPTIAADVSEDRLRRFFVVEHHGYRVKRELRESVLFAVHDLLKDAPFSRLDLITCRNLLIYLNRDAQARAFTIFNFSLKPEGRLFLGLSDSVEDGSSLFTVVNKKWRFYAPRLAARSGVHASALVGADAPPPSLQERERPPVGLSNWAFQPNRALLAQPLPQPREEQSIPWGELHFRLIDHFAPASLLVDPEYEIMHLSEKARKFLQFSGGEPSRNLLRVVHPMLRIELRAALYRAAQSQAPVEIEQVEVRLENEPVFVKLRVCPAPDLAPGFLLVIFDSFKAPEPEPLRLRPAAGDSITGQLERELENAQSRLRDVVEQYEASTEELKASNEELQAMNEELRSATEELETSREEMQSINEELTTVNQELKSNVDGLAHANSDLRNLMASTAIATVFLDRDQRITRFTPSAVDIFNLIPSDIGRPLADMAHRLDYPELQRDADRVLAERTPVEREVRRQGKEWYLARLLPYRTTDDRIGGLVLTFVDITERRRSEEAVRESASRLRRNEERLQALFSLVPAGIYTCDFAGRIDFYNQHAAGLWGAPPDAETRFCGFKTVCRDGSAPLLPEQTPMAEAARRGKSARYVELAAETVSGKRLLISQNIAPILSAEGRPIGAINVFLDVTGLKSAENAVRDAKAHLEQANLDLEKKIAERTLKLNETIGELEAFSYTIAHDMRAPLRSIQGFAALLLEEKAACLDATAEDYLTRIKTASGRLDRLIQDVLNYSRIVQQDLKLEPVDVAKLLGEILESYPNLRQSVAEITVEKPIPLVIGNGAALTQVFSNLLSNAIKFAKPGAKPRIRISAEPLAETIKIWVKDDGIGIDEAAQGKIFELFQQVNPGSQEGAGVGLAIVRKAVERMNGRAGVVSTLNQGASFWVELKSAAAPD